MFRSLPRWCAIVTSGMLLHCATILGISSGEDRDVASGGTADGGHGGVGGSNDGGAGVPSLLVAWADRWGAATNENVTGIAADDEGNVILVGSHYGPWMLAGASIPHAGAGDAFAAKFHPQDGVVLWAHAWGDDADQVALAVTQRLENEHQTYITGYYDGTLDVGNGTPPLSNSDNYDGFVVRVGDNSGPNSIFPFSGPLLQRPGPIATVSAAQQNLLITGYTVGDMGIANTMIPALGQARGFLARIYGGGQPDWALSFGGEPRNRERGPDPGRNGVLAERIDHGHGQHGRHDGRRFHDAEQQRRDRCLPVGARPDSRAMKIGAAICGSRQMSNWAFENRQGCFARRRMFRSDAVLREQAHEHFADRDVVFHDKHPPLGIHTLRGCQNTCPTST